VGVVSIGMVIGASRVGAPVGRRVPIVIRVGNDRKNHRFDTF
jgi:hypothetical protein